MVMCHSNYCLVLSFLLYYFYFSPRVDLSSSFRSLIEEFQLNIEMSSPSSSALPPRIHHFVERVQLRKQLIKNNMNDLVDDLVESINMKFEPNSTETIGSSRAELVSNGTGAGDGKHDASSNSQNEDPPVGLEKRSAEDKVEDKMEVDGQQANEHHTKVNQIKTVSTGSKLKSYQEKDEDLPSNIVPSSSANSQNTKYYEVIHIDSDTTETDSINGDEVYPEKLASVEKSPDALQMISTKTKTSISGMPRSLAPFPIQPNGQKNINLNLADQQAMQARAAIGSHLRTCHRMNPYMCNLDKCKFEFINESTFRSHLARAHPWIKLYACSECQVTFENTASMYTHKWLYHERGVIRCPMQGCDFMFRARVSLVPLSVLCPKNQLAGQIGTSGGGGNATSIPATSAISPNRVRGQNLAPRLPSASLVKSKHNKIGQKRSGSQPIISQASASPAASNQTKSVRQSLKGKPQIRLAKAPTTIPKGGVQASSKVYRRKLNKVKQLKNALVTTQVSSSQLINQCFIKNCTKSFKTKTQLNQHVRAHMTVTKDHVFHCKWNWPTGALLSSSFQQCNFNATSYDNIYKHLRAVHHNKTNNNADGHKEVLKTIENAGEGVMMAVATQDAVVSDVDINLTITSADEEDKHVKRDEKKYKEN